jgi:hypothetical protein
MTMTAEWQGLNPGSITGWNGGGPDQGSGGVTPGVGSPAAAAATRSSAAAPPWSPDSPLFWVAIVLAATAGLFTISVSAKAGPFRDRTTI